jgi:tetratricopeptide (TPR) repeat protein
MKAVVLSAGAALLVGIAPAQAYTTNIGSSYAESCYRAAEVRDTSQTAKDTCDKALAEEALSTRELAGTHVNRGILWMQSGALDRANQDFDQALGLDATQPEAWLNKGIAQMKAGNSRAALELAARSIELRTKKPAVAYYVRGLANEDTGNLKAAYADLSRARDLAPTWRDPAIELARYQVRSRY